MDAKRIPNSVFEWSQLVLDAVNRLRDKKASVSEVKTIIAGINSVQAGLALRQEQARLSGARVRGDVIMDLKNDPNAQPSDVSLIIDAKVPKQLEEKRTTKTRRRKAA